MEGTEEDTEEDTEEEAAIMVKPQQGIPSRVDTRYVTTCYQQSHCAYMMCPTKKPLDIAHSGTSTYRTAFRHLGGSLHAQHPSSRARSNCQSAQNASSCQFSANTYCLDVTALVQAFCCVFCGSQQACVHLIPLQYMDQPQCKGMHMQNVSLPELSL